MIYEMTVLQFSKMLKNLLGFLNKAAKHADDKKFDINILLQAHLAPDQFNFTRQVQIACDTAKVCVASLSNQEAPSNPDTEKTLLELRTRVESVISYLNKFTSKDFANSAAIKISRPRWNGKYLSGEEFLIQHAIPNFYFHLNTAYAILRHNGVDLGKKDYLGELPYKN